MPYLNYIDSLKVSPVLIRSSLGSILKLVKLIIGAKKLPIYGKIGPFRPQLDYIDPI